MFNTTYIGARCGKEVRTGFEQTGYCPGTMCPVNNEHTIWTCSACEQIVDGKKIMLALEKNGE